MSQIAHSARRYPSGGMMGAVVQRAGTNAALVQKPYSAVTVQVEVLTSEQYEVEDSSGIVDLIEAVTIQSSGPAEASRALRKKLSDFPLAIWRIHN